ncbi:MAG: hypothetical protein ACO2ZZ_06220 [Cyclobacteriaceae bacterium]
MGNAINLAEEKKQYLNKHLNLMWIPFFIMEERSQLSYVNEWFYSFFDLAQGHYLSAISICFVRGKAEGLTVGSKYYMVYSH